MAERPRGTVTFLFTDVEGSTRLLKQFGESYGRELAVHQGLLREAFAAHGGEEVDTQGDAFFYVFSRARDAAAAAADGQRALAAHEWPEGAEFRVRVGLHTGEPVVSDEGRYHGMGVHRTARIMAAGHGGQVLASQATASVLADEALEGVALRDLGEHELKDLDRPERIYQLDVDGLPTEFAPLKTAGPAPPPRPPVHRRPLVIGALAGVLAAAVAIPVFAFGRGGDAEASLPGLSANSVGVVDPATGAIVNEVPDVPTPTRIAEGEGAIWVTSSSSNSVYRIDPDSHAVRQTIRVGDGPTGIAVAGGDVWVANTLNGTVSRIDADSNEVVGDPIPVGNSPTEVAAGAGSVWVTNVDDRTVTRIDPVSGRIQRTLDVGASGRGIAVGAGAAWISDSAGNRVVRVDPKTNDIAQTIGVGSGPTGIAVGAGSVWVANTLDGTVSRIDSRTGQVRGLVSVGASPGSVAAAADVVWIGNEAGHSLARIDPAAGQVRDVVETGARPAGLALAGSLWVAGQAAELAHRGGTLRVESFFGGPERDPARAYDPTTWAILNVTNDGLVGFKSVGGGEGAQVVPNLAASVPTPTDDGKTYAFRLRKGIPYSNGQTVKASDVRESFERVFKARLIAPVYFPQLRGAAACLERPNACDLSSGIVADDDAGTVTFHLTAPDAEFLYKLATPFGSILPAGTPLSKGATRPVPATGPYMIDRTSGKEIHLVRNPRFRAWNAVAQPAGYPDEIVLKPGTLSDRAVADVAGDRTDLATGLPLTPIAEFATQHPSQVHTTPAATTFFWFLDTRSPPFDDVRARRAVNYAIDRSEFVRLAGGPEAAQTTCQVLPPNFPGYRPYCPYSAKQSEGGTWAGPDLAKALKLVRESGTAGARVEFWVPNVPIADDLERIARKTLTELGYRPAIRRFPDFPSYYKALDKAAPGAVNAGSNGWAADYPAPSNFLGALTCKAAKGPGAPNLSRYCSQAFDRDFARARALQSRDPAAAARLWAELDRRVTDSGVWVATNTPRNVDLVSRRVGNYQRHPVFGVLFDQLWVR